MKQTAVEWLVEKFDLTSDSPIIKNVVEQAKEMEKEQLIRFQWNTLKDESRYCGEYENAWNDCVLDYERTFKSE